ncbi:MAG: DUF262 domain-containing protein [Methylococcales bacterium]|nr:DUF262 domain-containing protein [Methylococcales bacterium]
MSIENLLQQIKEAKVSQKQTNIKVAHLISDFNARHIVIPEYQRQFVWDNSIQSRFVESIFMAIPIPAIFLLETIDDQTGITKNEVIDGVQRLSTLVAFTDNKLRLSKGLKLSGLEGQKFQTLPHPITQQFLNRDISIITIEKNTHSTIQFEIFERLNRGSVSLTHQELRNCMFHGEFNSFLNRISTTNKNYKELLSIFPTFKIVEEGKPDKSRMQDVEMVLRFLYLLESYSETSLNRLIYPKKEQLNFYMKVKKEQEKGNQDFLDSYTKSHQELEEIFDKVCQMVKLTFKGKHFRKFGITNDTAKFASGFNKAFFDIQMLGFVDYEIENIAGITDVIYNEFIELCCFNSVMTDNTNDKITERVNTWKELLLKIVTGDTNYYVTKLDKKIDHFNLSPICHSCNEKIETLDEGYCDLENNAFYHISCYINSYKTPNKNKDNGDRLFSNREIQEKISRVAMTIPEEELEQLCNKKESKEIFNIGKALFIKCPKNISDKLKRDAVKDANGINRWTWEFEFERNNFLYAITTQWFQYNDIKVNEWLLNHE